MKQKRYDIFISFRSEDGSEFAHIFASELRNKGYRVFFSQNDVIDGKYENDIDSAIHSAPIFIIMLTPMYLERLTEDSIIRNEIYEAIKCEKTIIPIDPNHKFKFVPEEVPCEIKDVIDRIHHSIIHFGDNTFKPTFDSIVENRIAPIILPSKPAPIVQRRWIKGGVFACFVILAIIFGYKAIITSIYTDSLFEELKFKYAEEEDSSYEMSDTIYIQEMVDKANKDDADATYWLGRHYLFVGNIDLALSYFREIKGNNPRALFWVGNYDFRGFNNNKPDTKGGKNEIIIAAQKGDPCALCWKGFLHISTYNLFNLDISYKSFLASARKGNPVAQYMIGEFYENGWGDKQINKDLAEKCRNYANKNGYNIQDTINKLDFYIVNNLIVDTARIIRESTSVE